MAIIHVTKQSQLAFCHLDQVMLVVFADRPSVADEELMEFIGTATAGFRARGVVDGFYTCSKTTTITGAQRKMLTDATESLGAKRFRVNAIVTDSALTRGALTAMSWFFSEIKVRAFPTSDAMKGLSWLAEHCEFDQAEACRALSEMLEKMGHTSEIRAQIPAEGPRNKR